MVITGERGGEEERTERGKIHAWQRDIQK